MNIRRALSLSHEVPSYPIDVVIPWVDDSDPLWRVERDLYFSQSKSKHAGHYFDAGIDRFRSWDNLQYIFRGIEAHMPWVRKIHLVTNGQAPGWLYLANPKLNFVKHSDYIPSNYLPTFNSHVIELNLHRIPGLAEHFIYFNDDTFVLRPMKPTDFFSPEGLPRDQFGLWRIKSTKYRSVLPHVSLNNMAVLNQNFNQRDVLRNHRSKLLDLRNGPTHLALTVLMSVISRKDFANILFHHMPAALLKQTFIDVWSAEPKILANTCSQKFRSKDDVSQYLIRAWQMLSGNFNPRNVLAHGEHFTYIRNDLSVLTRAVRTRRLGTKKLDMFCISDEKIKDFQHAKKELNAALEYVLPSQSSYEIQSHKFNTPETSLSIDIDELLNNGILLQGP
ncbi:MAG: Stealth CR1 domain-containing protein [Candidatus Saccharimonadales bacterium]